MSPTASRNCSTTARSLPISICRQAAATIWTPRRGRGWGALGVEGFAPYYAMVSATFYASDTGHYAAKLQAADEIRFTQRLILEPQAELNLYTRDDPARRIGSWRLGPRCRLAPAL